MSRHFVLVVVCALFAGLNVTAQTVPSNGDMVFTIPGLYGPNGLTLPNAFHSAHFNSSFQENFTPLNSELGTALTRLPLASPASGFVYTFDKSLGVWNQSNQSFGPILSERSETIGRHKLFVAFGYQHFGFSKLDGVNLHSLPAVFGHQTTAASPDYEKDYITTVNNIGFTVNQFTFFGTFGITNRLDVSVAIPFEQTNLNVTSTAHIVRIAAPSPIFGQFHYFDAADPQNSVDKTFFASNSASGIGDVIFRGKYNAYKGERFGIAAGLDVRVPSGDAMNLLGSGAVGVRPFAAFSYRARVSPHINAGYEWNGDSVLAGNVLTGVKGKLPNAFLYGAGVDMGMNKWATAVFDIVGQVSLDTEQIAVSTFTAANGSQAPTFTVTRGNVAITSASLGMKVNPWKNLLLNGNVLIKLNDGGLRATAVPYVGVSYTF